MLTREVKSVAIAALAAVAAIAMMALATPVFAAGQLIADGGPHHKSQPLAANATSQHKACGSVGVWTSRARR